MHQRKDDRCLRQANVKKSLENLCDEYPEVFRTYIINNRERFLYQVGIVTDFLEDVSGKRLLDIGAGFSPCSILLSQLGANITIVDDFNDPMGQDSNAQEVEALFKKYNVNVISGDLFTFCDQFDLGVIDAVMSFDSMEHWHNSPKMMFHKIYESMGQESLFFIGVPNCVNLRKRLTVPFGLCKWSSMDDWYESDIFRGHVREPDIDDLEYIAKDLGFSDYRVDGRNWIGYRSKYSVVRALIPLVDKVLQLNPALCSDLYLIARK